MNQFYAHTVQGESPKSWEPLADHLALVAKYCEEFAAGFGAGQFGRTLGLWHDLGKYSKEFQAYLRRENGYEAHLEEYVGRVDHSTFGAQLADRLFGKHPYGKILAYCIAGHHAGLADAVSESGESGLDRRLKKKIPAIHDAPPDLLMKPDLPSVPPIAFVSDASDRISFQLAFLTRMLFSCLVDADYLATEAFISPTTAVERKVDLPSLAVLREKLDQHLQQLSDGKNGTVAEARSEVLNACRDASSQSRGLYSLTVPTGGGKTLSSLAFGLAHAEMHGMERVIYAIPFTSIVEQTANVFRGVFTDVSDETILEHHCNTDPEPTLTTRLVTQNWDAPIVVTTNVQLFESLFAARTSSCRKLHNVCNSVIILDEVQSVPVDLLQPTLATIRELAENYGCTILLCTATQPAFGRSADFRIGLEHVTEIVPDPPHLFNRLKRVRIVHLGPQSDDDITERFGGHGQFLCIVNTRAHAANLFARLRAAHLPRTNCETLQDQSRIDIHSAAGATHFHLSTYMCGQHRKIALDTIRQRLREGLPCQVISTQLIEAGVDVDFPVVYRSMTGIDSIAQAAGRCNREGNLNSGQVFLFEPTAVTLRGYLKATADSASELIAGLDRDDMELLSQDIVRSYFGLHFWRHKDRWDAQQVMSCFPAPYQTIHFNFRTASERFRWIDDTSETVFVPFDLIARKLIKQLRKLQNDGSRIAKLRDVLRQLQRYSVSLFPNIFHAMVNTDIEVLDSGHAVLINESCYDAQLGFRPDQQGIHEPHTLIV